MKVDKRIGLDKYQRNFELMFKYNLAGGTINFQNFSKPKGKECLSC